MAPKYWIRILSILFIALIPSSKQEFKLCNNQTFSAFSKVRCYCRGDVKDQSLAEQAQCLIVDPNIQDDDSEWDSFETFESLEDLKISSFTKGRFSLVPRKAMHHLKRIKSVTLYMGNITAIKPVDFKGLNIEKLTLTANEIKNLEKNAFSELKLLNILTLDHNNITEIKRNVFVELNCLRELDITNNKIITIHDKSFEDLSNLQTLELDMNSIFVLTNETFFGLSKLIKLLLNDNQIEVIGDNTFKSLIHLEELYLDNNKIEVLDEGAFSGLKKLVMLSLSSNKLTYLDSSNLFVPLESLLVLDLKKNELRNMTKRTIMPLYNRFTKISSRFEFSKNKLSCDCHINWLKDLKNDTTNTALKEEINMTTCYPSLELSKEFKEFTDLMKTDNEDYDYYTEDDLNGQLFFLDIPDKMLPCPTSNPHTPILKPITKDLIKSLSPGNIKDKIKEIDDGTVSASIKSNAPTIEDYNNQNDESKANQFDFKSNDPPEVKQTTTIINSSSNSIRNNIPLLIISVYIYLIY